ncbi:MAG TPA: glyoxylate/hydroxypyruvate reductase A [Spirochaetaceae bacterium]|nr:glyoxylate/hydroxypyruvate reductase A [Spirochaetaceae bacterium]
MDIALYSPEGVQPWLAALSAAFSSLPMAGSPPALHSWPGAPACDYALLWRPPAAFFAEQPRLKAAFALGAGVDSLLAAEGLPADLAIYRIEDAGMADQMVEYALYACLERLRGFDRYREDQRTGRWGQGRYAERSALRVAVLGLGALGGAVARALVAFGFSVSAWSRRPKSLPGIACYAGLEGLEHTLSRADLLIILLPLSRATEGLLNEARLSLLPEGAWIVNLARGRLVHEQDLLAALEAGRIGRAMLDVFNEEPVPPGHPFWTHPRVFMTPHIAAITPEEKAARQIAAGIAALEEGRQPSGRVDRLAGY